MRRSSCLLVAMVIVMMPLGGGPNFASGSSQHQWGTAYLYWQGRLTGTYVSTPSPYFSQEITLRSKATATFWAAGWLWQGESVGAYLGLQTSGSLNFNGDSQEIAIFSVWDATAARTANPKTVCRPFSGEGIGFSCRHPIPIETGRKYRMKASTYANDSGQWISASIETDGPELEYQLGSILLPKSNLSAGTIYNFIEYFGEQRPCNDVQDSTAMFGSPTSGEGGRLGFGSLSIPSKICANAAADSPPTGTPGSVLLRFGGAMQLPSTTTTVLPSTTTTLPTRTLSGKRCQRVGALRKLGNKTYICKKTSKQLTWRVQT